MEEFRERNKGKGKRKKEKREEEKLENRPKVRKKGKNFQNFQGVGGDFSG